jgi:aryl-alcohol dehydrogenase-like predicted oxidoreductase
MTSLGLGTVQFGMPYGVANRGATTSHDQLNAILAHAARRGVRLIDTAALYGDSEAVLGAAFPRNHPFSIVTKTPKLGSESAGAQALVDAFERSLRNLRQPKLYGLLVHDANDLLRPGGDALWQAMDDLKRRGLVDRIGVSVYTAAQIDAVLERFEPTLVQVPLSIVDQRLLESGHLSRLNERGVEIHARSVFLQGLLLMHPAERPPYFAQFDAELSGFTRFLAEHRMTALQAALAFVHGVEEIDAAIVGVTSQAQLDACLDALEAPQQSADFSTLACRNESLLNPALWPTSR